MHKGVVGVALPDSGGGEVDLRLQGSELGLVRAGAAVILVPADQALEAGHPVLPAWETIARDNCSY